MGVEGDVGGAKGKVDALPRGELVPVLARAARDLHGAPAATAELVTALQARPVMLRCGGARATAQRGGRHTKRWRCGVRLAAQVHPNHSVGWLHLHVFAPALLTRAGSRPALSPRRPPSP